MALYGSDGSFYEKESHLEADQSKSINPPMSGNQIAGMLDTGKVEGTYQENFIPDFEFKDIKEWSDEWVEKNKELYPELDLNAPALIIRNKEGGHGIQYPRKPEGAPLVSDASPDPVLAGQQFASMKKPQLGDALTAEIDKQAAGMASVGRGGTIKVRRREDLDLEGSGRKAYTFHNPEGRTVGQVDITPLRKGKELYIDNIFSWSGPNALGPREMRHALEEVRREFYPKAELAYGYRISGGRELAGERFVGGVHFTPKGKEILKKRIKEGQREKVSEGERIRREAELSREERPTPRRIEQQENIQPDRLTTEDLRRLIRELDEEMARRERR